MAGEDYIKLGAALRRVNADSRRHAWWLVIGAFIVLAVVISLFSFQVMRVAQERREAERWHVHTLEVLLLAEDFRIATFDSLRGERGYLLTNNPDFLRPYHAGRRTAPLLLSRLEHLVRDNPGQLRNLAAIRSLLPTYLAVLDGTVAAQARGDHQSAVASVRSGRDRFEFRRMQRSIDRVEREERRLLLVRRDALARYAAWNDRLGYAAAAIIVVLLAIAALAAAAALRAQRRAAAATEELRRIASVDELTGLPNRRHFLARLEAEGARARRSGSSLCLAMLDLDHFKRINDTHGHAAGDAVLQKFAALLRDGIRLEDSVGRIGGEEFALLLPGTELGEARMVCERMRAAVAAERVILPGGKPVRISVSIGVSPMAGDEDVAALMRRSDEALYKAKEHGRNRVCADKSNAPILKATGKRLHIVST